MYLLDTNIWLERLLDQELSSTVGRFLAHIPTNQLLISDFTLHSIGVILGRLGQPHVLLQFVEDIFSCNGVKLTSVAPNALSAVINAMEQFDLDFDDAYQYIAAEQAGAVMISFDKDFDRTDRGRQTPLTILAR